MQEIWCDVNGYEGLYRLSIRGKIDKTYPTLEAAIRAREVVLNGEINPAG